MVRTEWKTLGGIVWKHINLVVNMAVLTKKMGNALLFVISTIRFHCGATNT